MAYLNKITHRLIWNHHRITCCLVPEKWSITAFSHWCEYILQQCSWRTDKAKIGNCGHIDNVWLTVSFDFLTAHWYKIFHTGFLQSGTEFQDPAIRDPYCEPICLRIFKHIYSCGDGRTRTAVQTPHQRAFYTFSLPLVFDARLPEDRPSCAYPLGLGGV